VLCHARLEIELGKDSKAVVSSLRPDDPEWCRCVAENEKILIEIKVEKPGTLLSALDDYLMNIKMCKRLLEVLGVFYR
jgi:tRNA threonylcarbamoyladenosine modification (KEOPS) complex  Pcc1 subunit